MCGIFGHVGNTALAQRMTSVLGCFMVERGKDSWGVTDGTTIGSYRSIGRIDDQFQEFGLSNPTYHTRHATVGAATIRNCHPFEVSNGDKRIVGVHNGHLLNWAELKHRYDRKNVEVDSEHIFLHLLEDKPLSDLDGWGAVVWYEQIGDGPIQRYHSRWSHAALAIAKMQSGEVVFASTERSLQVAAQMTGGLIKSVYETKSDVKYIFDGDELVEVGPMKWGPEPKPYITVTHPRTTTYNNNTDTRDICAMRDCHVVVKTQDLICPWCLDKIKKDYFGFNKVEQPGDKWPYLLY